MEIYEKIRKGSFDAHKHKTTVHITINDERVLPMRKLKV
jgi:hypothetical protein